MGSRCPAESATAPVDELALVIDHYLQEDILADMNTHIRRCYMTEGPLHSFIREPLQHGLANTVEQSHAVGYPYTCMSVRRHFESSSYPPMWVLFASEAVDNDGEAFASEASGEATATASIALHL